MSLLRMQKLNLHSKWRLTFSFQLSFRFYGSAYAFPSSIKLSSSAIISHQVEWQVVPSPAEEELTHTTTFIRLGTDGKEREVSASQDAATSV